MLTALLHSNLFDLVKAIELITDIAVLLCMAYIVSSRSMFAWRANVVSAAQAPTLKQLTLAARLIFGAWMLLNGLLMLAYLPYYKGALERAPLTLGESDRRMSFNTLFVQPGGRTARGHFLAALVPLALAALWYVRKGPAVDYASWGVLVLLYPAVVLHVRRLHDMGRSGWWVLVPAVLTVAAMLMWADRISLGTQLDSAVPLATLVIFAGLAFWGCIARGQAETDTLARPVAWEVRCVSRAVARFSFRPRKVNPGCRTGLVG